MRPLKSTRILVVEDQPAPRNVLAKIIARGGYEVQAASSAREAVEIGSSFCPHLLLADWLLQDNFSGLQVAEALRATQPGLSIIFLTGLPTDRLSEQARHVQPCTFIEKPCDFNALLDQIHKLAASTD